MMFGATLLSSQLLLHCCCDGIYQKHWTLALVSCGCCVGYCVRLTQPAISYIVCPSTLVESLSGFLNHFEYPMCGSIYKKLLEYALDKTLLNETIDVKPYLQEILSLILDWTVLDVEEALNCASLNCASAAFPYPSELAKGEFLLTVNTLLCYLEVSSCFVAEVVTLFLRQVATSKLDLYPEAIHMLPFSSFLSIPQQVLVDMKEMF
jgi:hypothetical protein